MEMVANTIGICDIVFDDNQMHFKHIISKTFQTFDEFTIIKTPEMYNFLQIIDGDNTITTIFFYIVALIVLFIIYFIYKQFKRNSMDDRRFHVARITSI
jgi:uncharacterized membrane protein